MGNNNIKKFLEGSLLKISNEKLLHDLSNNLSRHNVTLDTLNIWVVKLAEQEFTKNEMIEIFAKKGCSNIVEYILSNHPSLTSEPLGLSHEEITRVVVTQNNGCKTLETLITLRNGLFLEKDGLDLSKEQVIQIALTKNGNATLKILCENTKFLISSEGWGLSKEQLVKVASIRGLKKYLEFLKENLKNLTFLKLNGVSLVDEACAAKDPIHHVTTLIEENKTKPRIKYKRLFAKP